MESCETPAWTGYSCEDFPFRTTGSHVITEKWKNKAKYLTWYSIRLKFLKKTTMPNPVDSIGYEMSTNFSGHFEEVANITFF